MHKKEKGLISAATEIRPFCVGEDGAVSRFLSVWLQENRAPASTD